METGELQYGDRFTPGGHRGAARRPALRHQRRAVADAVRDQAQQPGRADRRHQRPQGALPRLRLRRRDRGRLRPRGGDGGAAGDGADALAQGGSAGAALRHGGRQGGAGGEPVSRTASRWSTSTSPVCRDEEQFGLILLEQAAELGITINMAPLVWPDMVARASAQDTAPNAMAVYSGTDYLDPDNFLWQAYHSSQAGFWAAASHYKNPDFDKLLEDARGEHRPGGPPGPLRPGPAEAGRGRGRDLGLHRDRERNLGQGTRQPLRPDHGRRRADRSGIRCRRPCGPHPQPLSRARERGRCRPPRAPLARARERGRG